jgi:DNA-binding phage protein
MLDKIKIKCINKDLTMTELAVKLGISREHTYRKIKSIDIDFFKKIEKILNQLDTFVSKV